MKIELYPEQEEVVQKLKGSTTTLVVAETGSGKTIIALKIILDHINQTSTKRALYIAPTNVLTTQHSISFSKSSTVPVFLIKAGSKNLNLEDEGIYITTAHYAKILCHQLSKTHFSIIVYDEAHKASSKNSPYVHVCNYFKPSLSYGFTASPGKKSNLKLILKNLNLDGVVYGASPHKHVKVTVEIPLKNQHIATCKYNLYNNWLKTSFSNIYGILNLPSQNVLPYLIRNKHRINGLLKEQNIPLYQYYIFFHLYYCGYLYFYEGYDTFYKYYSKLQKYKLEKYKMLKLLLDHNYVNSKFVEISQLCKSHTTTSLIFFQNYETVIGCKEYLLTQGFGEEEVEIIAGKSKMNVRSRDLVVKKTHENKVKILLATSVVEEGVDIQGVDQVIFYRPIYNKIKLIQRKGRTGRHRDGVINILYYVDSQEKILNVQ